MQRRSATQYPLVTIGIPTAGRTDLLREAIASAVRQQYPALEIVISDDVPSPRSEAVCRQFRENDNRIRYVVNMQTHGLAGNWNHLADCARGDYLMIIGDDDRLTDDCVSRHSAALAAGYDLSFSDHHVIDDAGNRLAAIGMDWAQQYGRSELTAGPVERTHEVAWRGSIPMSAALVKTTIVRRLRFDEALNTPEILLFVNMAQQGCTMYYIPEQLVEYRIHRRSETRCGLWLDLLLLRLQDVPAQTCAMTYKNAFLTEHAAGAVAAALRSGRLRNAREILTSPWYQCARMSRFRRIGYRVCAAMPDVLAPRVFGTTARARQVISYLMS